MQQEAGAASFAARVLTRTCLLGFVALLAGCGGEQPPSPDVVARVERQEIHYRAFETYLQENVGESAAGLESPVLSGLFDRFLEEDLLRRFAIEEGLVPADTTGRRAVRALLERASSEAIQEAEIRSYYESHPEEFAMPERVRMRQILVQERAVAERVRSDLLAGAGFDSVARDLPSDSSVSGYGGQGYLSRDDLPAAFVDVIFDLEVDEISEIVEVDYGFHVFQVTDRLPAENLLLEQSEEEIRSHLRRSRSDEVMNNLVAGVRDRYNVQVFRRNLPFNYDGAHKDESNKTTG